VIHFTITGGRPDFVRAWLAAAAAREKGGVHFAATVCRRHTPAGYEYEVKGWCYYFAGPAREVVEELTRELGAVAVIRDYTVRDSARPGAAEVRDPD